MSYPTDPTSMKPRKSARQARSAATVEVIVEAAARILEADGHAGFTTNAIAERAGVSVGSLYQYFPNKDAITRELIRRQLDSLETAIGAIDLSQAEPSPITRFVAVAVGQQFDRAALAQLLELEADRLGAGVDTAPVRDRVVVTLAAVLGVAEEPAHIDIVQDVMALVAALVNAAASRDERDLGQIAARVETIVRARLAVK